MTKIYLAIIVGGTIVIGGQHLLFADKTYLYDASTDSVFIDEAFGAELQEYKNAVISGEKVELVSYTATGAKIIHRTINAPKKQKKETKRTGVSEQKKEHNSPEKGKTYLGVFLLSRYYSCDRNQTKRLAFEPKSERNYKECMRRQFAGDGDPRTTADGTYLTNEQHANKTIACPRKYIGRTLIIEGYGEYKCNDVGGAIQGKRLDVYAGIGDYAVENFWKVPTGYKKIWIK